MIEELSLLKPSLVDFGRLYKYLLREKGIREIERIAPERLKVQYDKGMMVFLFVTNYGCDVRKGHPLACAVLWETADPNTIEIGTVWVHPYFRGERKKEDGSPAERIQEDVIRQLLALEAVKGKNLYAISLVPTFGKIIQKFGFSPKTLENMPDVEAWTACVGMPTRRVPSSIYRPSRMGLPEGERILYLRFAS